MERITNTDDVRIGDILLVSVDAIGIEATCDGWYVWLPERRDTMHVYKEPVDATDMYAPVMSNVLTENGKAVMAVEFVAVVVRISEPHNSCEWIDCYNDELPGELHTVSEWDIHSSQTTVHRLTHDELIERVGRERVY